MRRRLEAITGGAPIAPLVVLFGLNLVDELDRIAFGVMGPKIGETFRNLGITRWTSAKV